ncbi:MAG: polysaccharide deacetylase family protein [Kiritimatiellae bacterium]|nr:polysaccharide deacetylase family protein [Kiritimatiellia bacterium]
MTMNIPTLTALRQVSRPAHRSRWDEETAAIDGLKRFFHVMFENLGVNRIFRRINRRRVCGVRYHGVAKDDWSWAEGNSLQVRESEFRKQMLYLKRHFEVVPLESVLSPRLTDRRPRAVITFDDGYANNFTVAFPILRDLMLPATVFLTTAFLDRDWIFWYDRLFFALRDKVPFREYLEALDRFKNLHPHRVDEEVDNYLSNRGFNVRNVPDEFVNAYRTLRYDEVWEMGRSGLITFGSHTHRHELLTRMTLDEVEETLRCSWAVLEQIPGKIPFFCYPNGWYEPGHVNLVRSVGFRGAVTTRDGLWQIGECEYEIPRVGVGRGMRITSFAGYVSGSILTMKRLLSWSRTNGTE